MLKSTSPSPNMGPPWQSLRLWRLGLWRLGPCGIGFPAFSLYCKIVSCCSCKKSELSEAVALQSSGPFTNQLLQIDVQTILRKWINHALFFFLQLKQDGEYSFLGCKIFVIFSKNMQRVSLSLSRRLSHLSTSISISSDWMKTYENKVVLHLPLVTGNVQKIRMITWPWIFSLLNLRAKLTAQFCCFLQSGL